MKKLFCRKNTEAARKATAGERKTREIRLLAVDRRFGVGPTEERIVACCTAQLQAEIAALKESGVQFAFGESPSAKGTGFVSPTGFSIIVSEHIKTHD